MLEVVPSQTHSFDVKRSPLKVRNVNPFDEDHFERTSSDYVDIDEVIRAKPNAYESARKVPFRCIVRAGTEG